MAGATDTIAVMLLTDALRAWLRAHPAPSQVQASALVYELAALIARDADSVARAHALIDHWSVTMKHQITNFGVGAEHP